MCHEKRCGSPKLNLSSNFTFTLKKDKYSTPEYWDTLHGTIDLVWPESQKQPEELVAETMIRSFFF
jgi:hypothetical protein